MAQAFTPPPRPFAQGRVVHIVTGDPVAFDHTAHVIGGADGEVVPLPVTDLIALSQQFPNIPVNTGSSRR